VPTEEDAVFEDFLNDIEDSGVARVCLSVDDLRELLTARAKFGSTSMMPISMWRRRSRMRS